MAVRICCGLSGISAVGAGAYGAHALETSDHFKKVWERASTYHLAHSVAALGTLALPRGRTSAAAAAAFLAGNVLFSGSLYALAMTQDALFARIAPYGGMSYMVGWAIVSSTAVM